MQETFYKALLSLGSQHTNMRAWLYMVARNLCLNTLKKQQREVLYGEMSEVDVISEHQKSVECDFLDCIIKEERIKVLLHCIAKLDIQKREVLELQYFAGLSLKEIAHLTGRSYENVRVLSSRGKRMLRDDMEVEGYEL